MWGKIIIPMCRFWLNGWYGLYGPRCPLSSKRPINLISLSLSLEVVMFFIWWSLLGLVYWYHVIIVNSSPPCATFMCWWTGPALFQVMACCLSGAKPLPESMLPYCQLDHWEQTSVKFKLKWKNFHSSKFVWKCCLRNGGHFVQGETSWPNLCCKWLFCVNWLLALPRHQQSWWYWDWLCRIYRKISNIRRILVGNIIVDHSDVVGTSPVGAAPTTSSLSTWHLASRDSPKTATRQYENLFSVGIWCV